MSAIVASSHQTGEPRASDRATPSRVPGRARPGDQSNPGPSTRSGVSDALSRGVEGRAPDNQPQNRRRSDSGNGSGKPFPARGRAPRTQEKADHPILFQQFFKSVGPRTYAAQVKKATNGNHYIVFTEGRRDDKSGAVRKTRINIFSEDFDAFFDLLRQAAQYVKANPLSPEFVAKRKKMWASIARKAKTRGKSHPGQGVAVDTAHTVAGQAGSRIAPVSTAQIASPAGSANALPAGSTSNHRSAHPDRTAKDDRPRQEPPATVVRNRPARPLPSARAAAGA